MKFNNMLSKSIKEFKENSKILLKVNFWYSAFPYLIAILILLTLLFSTGVLTDFKDFMSLSVKYSLNQSIIQNQTINQDIPTDVSIEIANAGLAFLIKFILLFVVFVTLMIIAFLISILSYLCTIAIKSKESFKSLKKRVSSIYWKFVGLCVLLILMIAGFLFILFIIAMIITIILTISSLSFPAISNGAIFIFEMITYLILLFFSARFILAPFILVIENKKILESIKLSWSMSKNNWLKIFSYLILIVIAYTAVYFIFYLIFLSVMFLLGLPTFINFNTIENILDVEKMFSSIGPIINIYALIYIVYSLLMYLLLVPLGILFLRNVYFELKSK